MADEGSALIDAAQSGVGLIFVADWLANPSVNSKLLVPILNGWSNGVKRQIQIVTPTRDALPAKTKAFTRWLMETLQNELRLF